MAVIKKVAPCPPILGELLPPDPQFWGNYCPLAPNSGGIIAPLPPILGELLPPYPQVWGIIAPLPPSLGELKMVWICCCTCSGAPLASTLKIRSGNWVASLA